MRIKIYFYFLPLILIYLIGANIKAQERRFPDSPSGHMAEKLINVLQIGNDDSTKNFVVENFTSDFLTAFPLSQHVTIFNRISLQLGRFELVDLKKTGDLSAEMKLQPESGENVIRIRFTLADQPPYLLDGLDFEEERRQSHFTTLEELRPYLEKETAADYFSGVVLIAKSWKPVFLYVSGYASKSYEYKNRKNTKFNIGSINKDFTKVAVYQLAEQKRLNLTDSVGKYLSGFRDPRAEKITLEQLLTHRSGFGHYWNDVYRARFSELRSVSDYMELVKEQKLLFDPGSGQQYSNSGYVVLGAIVESVTGMDYYQYIHEYIYKPAGMTDSDHYVLDQVHTNLATGYTRRQPDGIRGDKYIYNTLYFSLKGSPAGGGYSTANDLLKFDHALNTGMLFKDPNSPEAKIFRHSGGIGIAGGAPGCNAILESDWDLGYTVIVLSNYDPPFAEELGLEIMEMLRRAKN